MTLAFNKKGDTVRTITDRADQALYLAKRAGKYRVATEDEIISD
jgi:PleD family two-component response regulator